MDTLSYKTISANKATVNKKWVLVDADGQTLGPRKSTSQGTNGKIKPILATLVIQEDNDSQE